jgi:NAD(P)H-hydrate epimerase
VDDEPLYVFTRAQAREVDRRCVEDYAIPSIVLMENAALGIATVVRDLVAGVAEPAVLVLAGPGNNGGDGLATARHLANDGYRIAIVLAAPADKYRGDALTNLEIARRMGLPLFAAEPSVPAALDQARKVLGEPDLVLDGLLGTGIDRPPSGVIAQLIEAANAFRDRKVRLLAVDVPSGLDADTGEPVRDPSGVAGPVIRADVTVALLGVKPGYLTLAAQPFVGDCLVAGIGAPRDLIERIGRRLEQSTDSDEQAPPGGGDPANGGARGGRNGGRGGDRHDDSPDRPIDGGGRGGGGRHGAGRRRPG